MPRSNRPRRGGRAGPRPDAPAARPLLGGQRYESDEVGGWHVRPVPGAAAVKDYRCPGCQQLIAPGTPHVLAWPADGGPGGEPGIAARRHWHRSCWQARAHRRPG